MRDYLAEVLAGLADLPIQRLADLTPAVWLAHSWNQATGRSVMVVLRQQSITFLFVDHSSGILESAAAGTAFSVLRHIRTADRVSLSVDDNEIVPL